MHSRRKIITALGIVGVAAITAEAFAEDRIRSGQKFAFLGASITEYGWNQPKGYLQIVVKCLEANGIKIIPVPAGVSGNTSRDMLARLDRDVIARKPHWVTVDAGGNDVWHGSVPFDEYMSNMTAIVEKAQKARIWVILQTCTPIMEDPVGEFNQKMVYFNQFQRYLAKQKHCVLADINEDSLVILRAKTGPDNILTTDGVHMNDRGNQVMAKGLLKALSLTEEQIAKTI